MSDAIETIRPTIWFTMEFHGDGDPMFGGSAADWALYQTGDAGRVFMSGVEAQRVGLVKAYFTNPTEAAISGEVYSKRGGSISALAVPENPLFSPSSIRWLVGQFHVGTSDDDLRAQLMERASKITDRDALEQMLTFALMFHRQNRHLVREFCL